MVQEDIAVINPEDFDEAQALDLVHYRHLKIKPWEYALENGMGFCEGCIIKYVSRYQQKDRLLDLLKARACLNFLIEQERAKER